MTYSLEFKPSALKEWRKLAGMPDCYKIKLKSVGYRLVYQAEDKRLVVVVVAVGKREGSLVYRAAEDHL